MTKSRLAIYMLCAIALAFGVHSVLIHFQQSGSIAGHTVPANDRPSALVRALRPNYPYSVIAGGAYSQPELNYADSKDPVVRAHYADFNVKQAKLVQLTDDRFQYASYRVKDQIYWTKKKLRIPKGELLWNDGTSYARARCGNRLSTDPKQPTRQSEPPEALLSLPPVRPDMLPKLALVEPPTGIIAPDIIPTETTTAPLSATAQVPAPVGTVWGPGPVTYPGTPVIVAPGGPLSPTPTPTTPVTPAPVTPTPSTPTPVTPTPTPTTPVTPVQPPNISPVPEPGSALYLFFLTLTVSLWAIYRFTPKDDTDESESKPE